MRRAGQTGLNVVVDNAIGVVGAHTCALACDRCSVDFVENTSGGD